MKLIAGLGNPEDKYTNNRHNVGFIFVDFLSEKLNLTFEKQNNYLIAKNDKIILIKPQTFMNDSGKAIILAKNFYKVDLNDIYIVHDDLDIVLGDYKIQLSTGPKIHNGINSIEENLKSKDFWRVRVGVDNRDVKNRIPGDIYVLEDFTETEKSIINKTVVEIGKSFLG